jgi:hypothetical protein
MPVGFTVGVNYYFDPSDGSWFAGWYFWYLEHDRKETSSIGLSGGYRWRFDSMWEVALGIGVGYSEEKTAGRRAREFVLVTPTLTLGYSFRLSR